MLHTLNFICFFDLTPEAKFLWASDSITDCVGYTPEEVIGRSAWEFVVPDDIPVSMTTLQENLMNDMVASQLVARMRHKNGAMIPIMGVMSACYEFLVNCCSVLDPETGNFKQFRMHSAAMTRMVKNKKEEYERIRRHHEAFRINTWDPNGFEPEPRVCMILNRFSRSLIVMYASPSCELILHIDSEKIVGKPFLVFIRSDDLTSFVEQVDIAKSSNTITHMHFWFQSPNYLHEIPCEAILMGSVDGLIVVIRRCRPFVRRRLIGDIDHFVPASQGSSYDSSSSVSRTSSSYREAFAGNRGNGVRKSRLRNEVAVGSIRRIIEMDDSQDNIKPLTAIQPDGPELVQEISTLPRGYYFREHRTQECNPDEEEIVIKDDTMGFYEEDGVRKGDSQFFW